MAPELVDGDYEDRASDEAPGGTGGGEGNYAEGGLCVGC